jgi:hypothetical protein
MVACDNAGLAVSSVSHIIDTNNVAAKLLLGQEAAASYPEPATAAGTPQSVPESKYVLLKRNSL